MIVFLSHCCALVARYMLRSQSRSTDETSSLTIRNSFHKLETSAIQRMRILQIQVHDSTGNTLRQDQDFHSWKDLCGKLERCRPEMRLVVIAACNSYENAVEFLTPLRSIRVTSRMLNQTLYSSE